MVHRLLSKYHANANARGPRGWAPIHLAAGAGDVESVRTLLDFGADPLLKVNYRNDKPGVAPSLSALKVAVASGHRAVVELLLQRGANANEKDNQGWTPLHTATKNGQAEILRLLLEHGADVSTKVKYADDDNTAPASLTALMLAAEFGHVESAKVLIQFGARVTDVDSRLKLL